MTNFFRFPEEEKFNNITREDNIDTYWDDDYDLKDFWGWEARVNYEEFLITNVIKENNITKILELGAGSGNLGNKIISKNDVVYHMIDGKSAKKAHERRNYKGTMFCKNLLDSFDTDGLANDYDLVIANDFIEHIRNPSIILKTVREKLTKPKSLFFVSSPNWRMKHHFYYPGLFDFDNFVKFFHQEGYLIDLQYESWSKKIHIQTGRLDSETLVPEENLFDWNYYLLFRKMS